MLNKIQRLILIATILFIQPTKSGVPLNPELDKAARRLIALAKQESIENLTPAGREQVMILREAAGRYLIESALPLSSRTGDPIVDRAILIMQIEQERELTDEMLLGRIRLPRFVAPHSGTSCFKDKMP